MFDPQTEDTGDCECPRCGGYATWHKFPRYGSVDIHCEACGEYTIPEDFDPETGEKPRHYGATTPADPISDDEPF